MLDLFELGEYFLNALKPIGDWLLSPIGNVYPDWLTDYITAIAKMTPPDQPTLADDMYSIMMGFRNISPAMLIFGGGLITIFSFKLAKLIADIVK